MYVCVLCNLVHADLSFFFQKAPAYIPLVVTSLSLYYILRITYFTGVFPTWFTKTDSSSFPDHIVNLFKPLGIALLISIVTYEYFADRIFSTNDFLILILSLQFLFYDRFPSRLYYERDFLLLFMTLITVTLLLPHIAYKIQYGYIGVNSEGGWFDGSFLIYFFLG